MLPVFLTLFCSGPLKNLQDISLIRLEVSPESFLDAILLIHVCWVMLHQKNDSGLTSLC